jgi:hypothetical protein
MDGDDAIEALATSVDTLLPARTCMTQVAVSTAGAATGTGTATFPAGRFPVSPRCVITVFGTTVYFAAMSAISPTSLTVVVRHYQGTAQAATVPVMIHAVQMLADAADG